jgi:hypothetical protein
MMVQYDSDFDSLSLTIKTSPNTVCNERDGVLYRIDTETQELIGITILGASRREFEVPLVPDPELLIFGVPLG